MVGTKRNSSSANYTANVKFLEPEGESFWASLMFHGTEKVLLPFITTLLNALIVTQLVMGAFYLASIFTFKGLIFGQINPTPERLEFTTLSLNSLRDWVIINAFGLLDFILSSFISRVSAEKQAYFRDASYALEVGIPSARSEIERLSKKVSSLEQSNSNLNEEVKSSQFEQQAAKLVSEQQQKLMLELQGSLKKEKEQCSNLIAELNKTKLSLVESSRKRDEAVNQAKLADLKANEYASKVIEQAIEVLEKPLDLLDAQDARIILEKYLGLKGEEVLDWKGEREIRSEAFKKRSELEQELGRRLSQEEYASLPELPDATATIQSEAGKTIYRLDIEIDGAYFNRMLKRKINGLAVNSRKSGRPVIRVSQTRRRAQRILSEIKLAGAEDRFQVLILENLSYAKFC
jgi:hypothetical protein